MTKRLKQKKKCQAYLTVYLALTMTILLSLCMALIEGARRNAVRLEAECVADIGLNSIFAEYHRELLEQYHLFAIDSAYGTDYGSKANTGRHLRQYVERNLSSEGIFGSELFYKDFLAMSLKDLEVTKVSLYTDGKGAVFRKRAAEAVKDDIGLTLLEDLRQWVDTVESVESDAGDVAERKRQIDRQMEEMVADEEERRSHVDEVTGEVVEVSIDFQNPTLEWESRRREGILKWVVEEPQSLSDRRVQTGELVLGRMGRDEANKGNMPVAELSAEEKLLERFFFQEYLMRYLGHYGEEAKESALWYQAEYLVAGQDGDLDNLRGVANRLCLMREAANAVSILKDEGKCLAAEVLATVIASLILMPEMIPPLKMSLLLAWAYAESLYDVKSLLAGGKIPIVKGADEWHYSLEGILQGGTQDSGGNSEGLSYGDYLRVFMTMTNLDTLTGRAMNLIEADIRQTPGNRHFRLDNCYDRIEAAFSMNSAYGYAWETIAKKGY